MNKLAEQLEENWPPHRVIASCDICQGEFLDTKKERPARWEASYVSQLIEEFAKGHETDTGHASIDVEIYTEPTPVREIDCHVTVNTQ